MSENIFTNPDIAQRARREKEKERYARKSKIRVDKQQKLLGLGRYNYFKKSYEVVMQ